MDEEEVERAMALAERVDILDGNHWMTERLTNLAREVDAFQDTYEGDLSTQRHNAAVSGLATSHLAGMHASPELLADIRAWIQGELTTEEVSARVIARSRATREVQVAYPEKEENR